MKRDKSPFAYKLNDPSMSKERAPQYYPPNKRKEFKDHLTKSSIKFNQQPMPYERPTDIMCK